MLFKIVYRNPPTSPRVGGRGVKLIRVAGPQKNVGQKFLKLLIHHSQPGLYKPKCFFDILDILNCADQPIILFVLSLLNRLENVKNFT
jgi:hypothetical protein